MNEKEHLKHQPSSTLAAMEDGYDKYAHPKKCHPSVTYFVKRLRSQADHVSETMQQPRDLHQALMNFFETFVTVNERAPEIST